VLQLVLRLGFRVTSSWSGLEAAKALEPWATTLVGASRFGVHCREKAESAALPL